jgi:hypothetical protein
MQSDTYYDERPVSRSRYRRRRCVNCGSAELRLTKDIHVGGWVILGVSLFLALFFFVLGFVTCFTFFLVPLCLLGVLGILWKDQKWVCDECGWRSEIN